jgi:DNA repair protein RAD50
MSRLSTLKIQGIRSFDDRGDGQHIKFETPLTLIVGQNGTGKTTIIECLKYVFTGMQPPNTKVGGAFVHDPKLDSRTEVKAMVAAAFKSAQGDALTVARRMELTVKKTTRSLKSLEASLLINKRGVRTVISSRVAELDQILPLYLGVSTAVLDNVIFCHQDESFWPLSDPGTLKKKFDEIFEAQKYTKAIANIKEVQKTQKAELGKLKEREGWTRKDKDRAIQVQKSKDKLSEEIDDLKARHEEVQQRMAEARKMADKTWRQAEAYSETLGKLAGKRIELQSKQSIIDDLQTHLEEVGETDEWLQNALEQFDARQDELQEEIDQKKRVYLEQEDHTKKIRHRREERVTLKGKYEEEKDAHGRNLARQKDLVKEIAAKHQIREYEYFTDDSQVDEFMVKIRKLSRQQKDALDRAKTEHTAQRRDAQTQVNRLAERKSALRDQKINARKRMDSNDQAATGYQRRADDCDVDEGAKAVAESRVEDVKHELTRASEASKAANWDKKLQATNAELRDLEDVSSALSAEMVQSTKRATELAALSHAKQQLNERQKRLETLQSAHAPRITSLLGERTWDAASVEDVYRDVLKTATEEVTTAERKRDGVSREMEQLQFRQTTAKKDLARMKTESENSSAQILATTGRSPEGYDEALREAEQKVEFARDNNAGFKGLHDYYVDVLDVASGIVKGVPGHKPACRTCNRGWPTDRPEQLAKFKQRIQDLITKLEKDAENSDPSVVEAEYKRVLELGSARDVWRKLTISEIPATEKLLADLESLRQSLLSRLDGLDKVVAQAQQVKRDVESIGQTVTSITKCDGEVKALTDQVADLSAKKDQQDVGRTAEEIQEELTATTQAIRSKQIHGDALRKEQEQSRKEISNLELKLRKLESDLNRIGFQLEKKAGFAERVAEFRAMNDKEKEAIDKLTSEMDNLEPQISTAQAKYDDIDQRATAEEREMSDELSRLADSVNNLDILHQQIQSYLDREGPKQLARVNQELKNMEQELETLEKEKKQLTGDINKINDRIKDGESTRRRYSDNLRYRRESQAIALLEEQIGELESENAQADRERFQRESERYTQEYNKLYAQQSGLVGEMKSKDGELARLLKEYDLDLKDATRLFQEAHIRVETTKAAVEDLGRYGGALDKAIMKYHTIKMDEINGIIDELWRKTYRGSDVDTILIKAENESARSNRSYNYRVVMVKRGAEMDMRGRCSAGQKVLASIIIRLALAECFSANCGLIALDEPTTNLDRDNIESLARSLKDIIEYRRQQANFQLVVITHDEDFLRQMECAKFAGSYYRVHRDAAQNSIIHRQDIADVL